MFTFIRILFKGVCDNHAPYKDVKVRSQSAPWINNTIRLKINRRFKLFKKAVDSKNAEDWANYKILRNEITSDIRKAKAAYFQAKLDEVKTSGAYWNLLNNATKPKATKSIGPLKRENERLAVDDKEKHFFLLCRREIS